MKTQLIIMRLKNYGADIDGAIERFIDDESLYCECVQKFLIEKDFAMLGEALVKNDYKAVFESAHSLKGISGNLGLTPIYGVLCSMVEALRAKKYGELNAQYSDIMSNYEKIRAIVQE